MALKLPYEMTPEEQKSFRKFLKRVEKDPYFLYPRGMDPIEVLGISEYDLRVIEDYGCPIRDDVVDLLGATEKDIRNHCRDGCCPACGRLFIIRMMKKKRRSKK